MIDSVSNPPLLTIGQCATLACLLEATAAKPGNVHRGADFEDSSYVDFLVSAAAIGPVFDRLERAEVAGGLRPRVGQTVLEAVRATRSLVSTNTNLGMILLLAPLAHVSREVPLRDGIADVLGRLTAADCTDVYAAIRLATPGGLGKVSQADVQGVPPDDLRFAMGLAADRDLVARQYVTDFADVFTRVLPRLQEGMSRGWTLLETIVWSFVGVLAEVPDTLVARKLGSEMAATVTQHAAVVRAAGVPGDDAWHEALADFDFWLRCDGHRRNPGATADLIAAGIFAALREGLIARPMRFVPFAG